MKAEDIDLRPIYHDRENRVRAHVLLCMLATYLTWHLRQVLAPLTFTDNQKPAREDPVIPARRSAAATAKDTAKITPDKLPVRGYHELVAHLATLTRNTVSFNGRHRKTLSTDPGTAPRIRPARQANPAPPRHSVTSVATNGGRLETLPDGKTPGQHQKSRNRRSCKDGLDVPAGDEDGGQRQRGGRPGQQDQQGQPRREQVRGRVQGRHLAGQPAPNASLSPPAPPVFAAES